MSIEDLATEMDISREKKKHFLECAHDSGFFLEERISGVVYTDDQVEIVDNKLIVAAPELINVV